MHTMITLVANTLLLGAGLIALWFSSKHAVAQTVHLAERYDVSHFFSGFIVLALSTSFPEMFVTAQSIMRGTQMLAIGNIIGSNLNNLCLAIGLAALLYGPISLRTISSSQIIIFIFGSLAMGIVFFHLKTSFLMGALLCIAYFVGVIALYKAQQDGASDFDHRKHKISQKSAWPHSALFIYLLFMLFASQLVVESSIALVSIFSLNLSLFGSTVLAFGTVLPEISLNLHSVRIKDYPLALGNTIGSIFAQSTLILGILILSAPHGMSLSDLTILVPFMSASTLFILFHLMTRTHITRLSGLALFSWYLMYLGCAFIFGQ